MTGCFDLHIPPPPALHSTQSNRYRSAFCFCFKPSSSSSHSETLSFFSFFSHFCNGCVDKKCRSFLASFSWRYLGLLISAYWYKSSTRISCIDIGGVVSVSLLLLLLVVMRGRISGSFSTGGDLAAWDWKEGEMEMFV